MDFIAAVNRIVGPIKQRIFLMLARGIVTAVSNTNGFQKIAADLLDEENADGLDRYQEYGFAAKPLVGAQALTGFLAGNRSHGVVFCIDDVRYRFTQLENGEVCLFTYKDKDAAGHRIHFKADGTIETKCVKMTVGESTKAVVLHNDSTTSSLLEDSTFWTWLAAAGVALSGLGVVAPIPTSLTGRVAASSTKLEAE